jgi:hypothetical protein
MRVPAHGSLLGLSLVALVLLAGWRGVEGQGGKNGPGGKKDGADGNNKPVIYGIEACRDCHDGGKPRDKAKILPICRLDEIKYWRQDKHGIAFEVLKTPRSSRMGEILGINEVTTSPQCLNCHSVTFDTNRFARDVDTFHEAEGVSCVACHGADAGWADMHGATTGLKRKMWREKTREEKEKTYGMIDLWDAEKRAQICASYHVGNAGEKKVVTHDMYAAGHPPLPGFEVASFSDQMPRHWQYLSEKPKEIWRIPGYNPAEVGLERTELVLVGGLVSFRESLKLLADQAAAPTHWPELAQFDCYACHHDLKPKSWRQERGYAGLPGRPTMRSWATALAELAMPQGTASPLEGMSALTAAFDTTPYGKPNQVATAARNMAAAINPLLAQVRKQKMNQEAAGRLLHQFAARAKGPWPDYDSARQFAWAYRLILSEAFPDQANSPAVVKSLKALDEQLRLTFPQGREPIVNSLPHALGRISAYEPARFRQAMSDLAAKTVGGKN